MRCCAQNCTNEPKTSTKSHGVTFHGFPKEPELRAAWVEALGLRGWEPSDRSILCSVHFSDKDFHLTKKSFRRLKPDAVPIMQPSEGTSSAMMRVCRICLAVDVKMCAIGTKDLENMYEKITGLMLCKQECLPFRVCWECGARLRSAMSLRSQAHKAHTQLADLMKDNTNLKVEDVISLKHSESDSQSDSVQKTETESSEEVKVQENIKTEPEICNMDSLDTDDGIHADPKPDLDQLDELPIKHESTTEIYFANFNPYDDDKSLSDDDEPLLKMRKVRVVKKKKKVGEKRAIVKKVAGESPESLTNRYKQTFSKPGPIIEKTFLDENLFEIRSMTYEEQVQEVLKRKETSAYRNAPFKCEVCFRGFLNKDRYAVHYLRHEEKSGAFQCFICKTRLKTSDGLRKHLTAQHTKSYACKGCPFVTKNRGVARDHEKWHAGTSYQCHQCASVFTKLTTYLGHIRIKHASDFVCELCGFTFVSEKGIDVHKRKKHRTFDNAAPMEGPYCEVCKVKFLSEEAHQRHLQLSSKHASEHTPNRIRNDSQALFCKPDPRARIERRQRIYSRGPNNGSDPDNQPEPNTPVTCEQCGAELADLRLYAQHFRRAHPDKTRTKYPALKTTAMCELCGRIFQSMAHLKDHMWVHTGEKRFKCDRCPKSFTQKTNLMFHMRIHSATRPTYICPVCGKQFLFYNNRRRHMFIHTGLKPFKCETCAKCFTTSGELRAHVDHVHMKKPWPKRARGRRDVDQGQAWPKDQEASLED